MPRLRVVSLAAFKVLGSLSFGVLLSWLVINVSAGPGVTILSQEEAEGPRFSDPNTLDIITKFARNRVCPSTTQRWVWRWTTYEGKRIQQTIPLMPTSTPFLAQGDEVMVTLPSPGVPDLNDTWYYRTVTTEQCGFLPTWASVAFGTRIYRSIDEQVNFVGAPHHKPEAAP